MTNTAKRGKAGTARKTKTSAAAGAKRKQNVRAHLTDKKAASSPRLAPRKPTLAKSNGTSKADEIIRLLQRKSGASIIEIQKATGWQPHSVRGFLSGTVKKRLGCDLRSEKSADGARRYVIGVA
jgi:hypothetical protein